MIPETAKSLAMYDDPFFGKYPAITENKFGRGSFIYEGCLLTDEIQSKIVANKALEIGLLKKGEEITYPIVVKSGINDQGKTVRYYLNYSATEQAVTNNYEKGIDLLNNRAIKSGDHFVLKPWDLLIIEE
jgi:beta-galactosidase